MHNPPPDHIYSDIHPAPDHVKSDHLPDEDLSDDLPPGSTHLMSDNLPDNPVDLTSIQLPSKVRKRDRLKGSNLTVIGLPKKKK